MPTLFAANESVVMVDEEAVFTPILQVIDFSEIAPYLRTQNGRFWENMVNFP